MAANHNRNYNRRSDQTAYQSQSYNPQNMRSQMAGQGPAGQHMQIPPGYAFGQLSHGYGFQQMAQQQMAPTQYIPDQRTFVQQMPYGGPMQYAPVQGIHQGNFFQQPQIYMQPHMMGQTQQPQPSPHTQMTQHSAHSSPTPPMHQQQQQHQQQQHQQQQQTQQQQQPQQQPPPQQQVAPQPSHVPKPKSKGIKIVDPNTNQEIDVKALAAKQQAAPSFEPTDTKQSDERRNAFKEQVHQSLRNVPAEHTHQSLRNVPAEQRQAKSAPHTSASLAHTPAFPAPKIEQRVPVEIKKTPSPAKPVPQSGTEPAKSGIEPAKSIAPLISILPRSNSQSEEKTPEKQGVEISVQTTPSLKKCGRASPVPSSQIPAPPKFDSPKKVEIKSEKVEELEKKKDFDNINSIGDKKLDGETIIIDNSSRKEAVKEETKKEDAKLTEEVKTKPTEEVKAKPTEAVKAKPTEAVKAKPTEAVKAKPTEAVKAKPTEAVKAKPTEEVKAKPTEEVKVKAKPTEEVKAKPTEEVKAKPTEEMKAKPTEEVIAQPTEEVKANPTEEVKATLTEEVKTKPTEEVKANGVVEKAAEKLTIEIPNGQEEVKDDVPSSEESSECKDQFETPPATPSDRQPTPPPTPVVEPKPAEKGEEAGTEPETTAPVKIVPVKIVPVKIVVEKEVEVKIVLEKEVEEGEIAEEEEEEKEEEKNPIGPFRYSREEMVALREAQDKPLSGVPQFDCIMDKPILKAEPVRPRPNNQFVPSWEQSGSRNRSRGGGDRNRSMDKNHSSMDRKPRIIEHTLAPVVTRKKSSNAWLSKREDIVPKPKETDDNLSHHRLMRGNIVSILNRITPQNFKEMSVQILQLHIDNMDKLELAVEIIFEKAVLEPGFSQTYANLCKIMGSIKFADEQNPKVSPFRKTLLNRCQKEFFREKNDEDKLMKKMADLAARTDLSESERQSQTEEIHYQRSKLKKKMLGNINFIGELFNLGMLSSKIIISQCIGNLISKKEKGKLDDEVIECLAKLFSTVGLKLEMECDDDMKKRTFEDSFGSFKAFATDKNYPYRIRFMIQDVVDLRENNWVPRRIEAKPQRIDDIHREHAREEQEKRMEATVALSTRKSKSRADSRDERGRGSRDGRMEKHDFTPAPKRVNTNIDMSKISGANQKLDSAQIVLGPSRQQWGRGSGTGSGANSPLSGSKEDLTTTTNRYDMLGKSKLVPGRTSSAPATRKMMERDRAAALASAQAIARPGRRTPSQSPVRSAPQKEDPLSSEEIRKKTKSILAEYFDIEEIEEACACIKDELQLVKKHCIFVQQAIDVVMEAKPKCLKLLGELFLALFEENPPLMTADGLLTGFQPAFEVAQDLAIDVPAVYANFGKLLGETFAKGHLTFRVIKGALGPLKESDKAGLVMCEVIKSALDVLGSKGRMEIQQKWGKDKMSWSELCNNPADLIERYKLDFLSATSEPKESVSETSIDISVKLGQILHDDTKSKEDVFNYIDQSVPKLSQKEGQFIKDLMRVACVFCVCPDPHSVGMYTVSDKHFSKLSPILMKYLQSHKDNQDVELHALDAVQLLVHEYSHPRDLGSNLFCKLEDDDIITEQGFRHWRENGKEQQGHGVMRQNLKNFFEDLSQDSADDSDTNSEHVK